MKCPECGRELREVKGVTYGGKHAYSCIVCGYKGWLPGVEETAKYFFEIGLNPKK